MTTKTTPTAYSIQTARNIASGEIGLAGHVINSLCDDWEDLTKKVAELEAALNPKPIGKETLLNRNDLLEHLFIEAFAATFPKETKNKGFKELVEAKELRLILLANGVPLDAAAVCVEWEKQVDKMISEKAGELIREKMEDHMAAVSDMMEAVKTDLKDRMEKLGIVADENQWG